jgi:hypothetical protein
MIDLSPDLSIEAALTDVVLVRANALEYEGFWRLRPACSNCRAARRRDRRWSCDIRIATLWRFVCPMRRLASTRPSGKRPLTYWAEHLFLLAMVVLLVVLLSAVGVGSISDPPG